MSSRRKRKRGFTVKMYLYNVVFVTAVVIISFIAVFLSGKLMIDTSALTGESVPRGVHAGDEVLAGCINGQGLLTVRVTKEYDDEETELEVMDKIKDYNSRLEEMCGEKGLTYIDITTMLEDNDGYFVYYYAETDGVHFKPTAYKMLLSKIQYTLS